MAEPIKGIKVQNATLQTFQSLDGSNFTTGGVNFGFDGLKGVSVYAGVGTNFRENTTGAVIDLKAYDKYAEIPLSNGQNITISAGGRLRNNINPASQTFQLRFEPLKTKIPLNDNVSVYFSPYILTKSDYKNITAENLKNNFRGGAFGGVTIKLGNLEISPEYQTYDFTNPNNASGNLIISYNF